MKYCSACGTEAYKDADICLKCGEPFETAPDYTVATPLKIAFIIGLIGGFLWVNPVITGISMWGPIIGLIAPSVGFIIAYQHKNKPFAKYIMTMNMTFFAYAVIMYFFVMIMFFQ